MGHMTVGCLRLTIKRTTKGASRIAMIARIVCVFLFVGLSLGAAPYCCADEGEASPSSVLVTGETTPEFEPLDRIVLEAIETVDCQTATAAVSRNGRLLYSQGYGWKDQERTVPTPPDALLRIASVTKPFTAAAVKNAVREGRLSSEDRPFAMLDIPLPPDAESMTEGLERITVGQLLAHEGGWDRGESFDPMFRVAEIRRVLGLEEDVEPVHVVRYMLTQPLQFAPGERSSYSNFGYCVLGRLLEKTYNKPYHECIQESVLAPLELNNVLLGRNDASERHEREVWHPIADDAFDLDVMDAHGGLIASANDVCRFLDTYWISGEPRETGQSQTWTFFGSLPGTTAMVRQHPDGWNVVILMNGRRGAKWKEDAAWMRKSVDEWLDSMTSSPSDSELP
jgi:CubicO group peptidase (beta-lactamase class C family)